MSDDSRIEHAPTVRRSATERMLMRSLLLPKMASVLREVLDNLSLDTSYDELSERVKQVLAEYKEVT